MIEYRIAYEVRETGDKPKKVRWIATHRGTIFSTWASVEREAFRISKDRGSRNVSIETREVTDWVPLSIPSEGGDRA